MERSESIKELSKALVEFHKKVGKVVKDSIGKIQTKSGASYSYKYATISSILDAVQESLNECGLSVIQFPVGEYGLETMLSHTSGEYMISAYTMKPANETPQGHGSRLTYQRRYAMAAILGINIDEDDDGALASMAPQQLQKQQQAPQQTQQPAKKILTQEALNDKFMAWVFKKEQEKRAVNAPFSLKSLLENNYRVDDETFSKAIEIYNNYKINNNLK